MNENNELIEKIFKSLKRSSRLIGSRRWGGHTAESDYDFVVNMNLYTKIEDYCHKNEIWIDYNNGSGENNLLYNKRDIKIKSNNLTINILGYDNEDMYRANGAFDIVDNIVKIMKLKNKVTRHRICEDSLDLFFKKE
ncbi:MAG: hypothetical protein DRQ78_07650 [Epsilonproteobacteria bacterium]|nr:MAG: hypothetical protein DRQ78_07650 [Campylobacterota bacterium]